MRPGRTLLQNDEKNEEKNSNAIKNSIDGVREICYSYDSIQGMNREGLNMYIKQATVNNQVGLHARPATFFIQKANEFKSTIWVEKDEQRVNAKSLLGVLSLGIIKGSTIDLIADGTDEKDAVDALVELISSDFAD